MHLSDLGSASTLLVLASLGGLALGLAHVWRLYIIARLEVKQTSRYPMFAVRDRLIRLVMQGKADRSDNVWRQLYSNVNNILREHEHLNGRRVFTSYLEWVIRCTRDPEARKRAIKRRAATEKAVKQCPELREILNEGNEAFFAIVAGRSGPLHRLLFRLQLPLVVRRLKKELLDSRQGSVAIGLRVVPARMKQRSDRPGSPETGTMSIMRGPQPRIRPGDLAAWEPQSSHPSHSSQAA